MLREKANGQSHPSQYFEEPPRRYVLAVSFFGAQAVPLVSFDECHARKR
jgi:hypothetical protein